MQQTPPGQRRAFDLFPSDENTARSNGAAETRKDFVVGRRQATFQRMVM